MSLLEAFADLDAPRASTMVAQPLLEIIAMCAILCGAATWVEVESFGQAKAAWFQTWLTLPHGNPSHDTFGRVFAHLDTEELAHGFGRWVAALPAQWPDGDTLKWGWQTKPPLPGSAP